MGNPGSDRVAFCGGITATSGHASARNRQGEILNERQIVISIDVRHDTRLHQTAAGVIMSRPLVNAVRWPNM